MILAGRILPPNRETRYAEMMCLYGPKIPASATQAAMLFIALS